MTPPPPPKSSEPPPPKKKNKNKLKFKIFNPKNSQSLCMKISEYPPPPPPHTHTHRGTNGQTDLTLLLKSEISNISFCLAPLIIVHANCYYQIKGHLNQLDICFPMIIDCLTQTVNWFSSHINTF